MKTALRTIVSNRKPSVNPCADLLIKNLYMRPVISKDIG